MDKSKIIDAEFRVVSPRRWWQGWYIDWTTFWICIAVSAASAMRHLS